GVARDEALAFALYSEAAAAGDADAQVNLGLMYLDGRGTAPDLAQALHWTEQAAGQGHPIAHNNLGHIYEHGLGVAADRDQALYHYRLAADLGYALGVDNHARLAAAEPASEVQGPLTEPYPAGKIDG